LKKRSKKLLILRSAPVATRAPESKSFLVLFFKKERLPSLNALQHLLKPGDKPVNLFYGIVMNHRHPQHPGLRGGAKRFDQPL
jgi:hypothetical protein